MYKPKPQKLKNGMTVLLVPQKGAVSMTMFVMVKVGSRYETRAINGASHFIEHLMFKGTKKRPSTEILSRTLDRFGAEYNAFTSKDSTAYYIKMDAVQTPLAIDMLYDMLFHSLYDSKEIQRERGVIIEEINMYEDNPRMHLEDLLEEALFPDSILGWNIAGPREVIRKISRDELVNYRDAYYTPERMTIAIAGKILPGTLERLQKTFGSIRPHARDASTFAPFAPPPALKKPVAFQKKQTEQIQLGLACYGRPIGHADLPAVNVLATILGGSMSSRLFLEIRERRGLCYSIRASHDPLQDVGIFSITAGLVKNRFEEAIREILKQMKRMTETSVSADEMRRAKDHMRGRMMLAFEDSETQAEWYARQWTFQGTVLTPEEKMKQIEKVTTRELRSLARSIFQPSRMAMAVIGPLDSERALQKLIRV